MKIGGEIRPWLSAPPDLVLSRGHHGGEVGVSRVGRLRLGRVVVVGGCPCGQGCQMAKFDPFLSLDCAPHTLHPGAIQGKERITFCHLATLATGASSYNYYPAEPHLPQPHLPQPRYADFSSMVTSAQDKIGRSAEPGTSFSTFSFLAMCILILISAK